MKTWQKTHSIVTGALLLLLLGFFSFGNVRIASAQSHHGSMGHSPSSVSSECQTRCTSLANTAALPQQENSEKEKEPEPPTHEPLRILPFTFPAIKKLSTTVEGDARLLRPPDKLALNCLYRI